MVRTEDVLVSGLVTEKSNAQTGKSTFIVHKDATKGDVKKAVKEFYGMDVTKVSTSMLPKKTKGAKGRVATRRSALKKAVVTLPKKEDKIEFNSFK